MAHFIFSNEKFLALLDKHVQETRDIGQKLFMRLGVKPALHDIVTILIISADSFAGYDAFFTLGEECEHVYGKKIDPKRIRPIVLRNLEEARISPHLERASFVLFLLDKNPILGVENYPELEHILFPK